MNFLPRSIVLFSFFNSFNISLHLIFIIYYFLIFGYKRILFVSFERTNNLFISKIIRVRRFFFQLLFLSISFLLINFSKIPLSFVSLVFLFFYSEKFRTLFIFIRTKFYEQVSFIFL